MTGSGTVVREMWRSAGQAGDERYLICCGYPSDDFDDVFGENVSVVTFTSSNETGDLPFPVPGMSDVMPYESLQYVDLTVAQRDLFIQTFRDRLARVIQEFRPDVIHIHHLWLLTQLARCQSKIPVLVSIHGTGLKLLVSAPQHRNVVAEQLGQVSHFFSVSRDYAQQAADEYGIPDSRLSLLGNGYDEMVFRWHGAGVDVKSPIILGAGKFVHWKGFHYLIRAAAKLSEDIQLVILGSGPERRRQALVQEAEQAGIAGRMRLPGHLEQKDVARWMRSASVFALPSVSEPFGLVLLEAMACGCQVVASRCGGPKDIISPELEGLGWASFVSPVDVTSPVDEDRYVLELAQALREHLSRPVPDRAKKRIASEINMRTWAHVYQEQKRVYQSVLKSSWGSS